MLIIVDALLVAVGFLCEYLFPASWPSYLIGVVCATIITAVVVERDRI